MTFCIGIRVLEGLVFLSDTRVVKGSEISRKSKLSIHQVGDVEIGLMTSGLRSVRDKVVARMEDELRQHSGQTRAHQVATLYGDALRVVRGEDGPALGRSGLAFNSHAIMGGRLIDDEQPMLFHVYPEGNWVEATDDAVYSIVGRSSYGKPILDRLLTVDSTIDQALTLAYLAFDATRASAVDVDFPIEVAVMRCGQHRFHTQRFDSDELAGTRTAWNDHLRNGLGALPSNWAAALLADESGALA